MVGVFFFSNWNERKKSLFIVMDGLCVYMEIAKIESARRMNNNNRRHDGVALLAYSICHIYIDNDSRRAHTDSLAFLLSWKQLFHFIAIFIIIIFRWMDVICKEAS